MACLSSGRPFLFLNIFAALAVRIEEQGIFFDNYDRVLEWTLGGQHDKQDKQDFRRFLCSFAGVFVGWVQQPEWTREGGRK